MAQEKKYDVFISSKSEDYPIAEQVYDFLVANGLTVFFANVELSRIGEAEYSEAVDAAIDGAHHMIVVATSLEYLNSKWVSDEWTTFANDLRSNYKEGNLLTILGPKIQLKDLPTALRHKQSFPIKSYKENILDYLYKDKRIDDLETPTPKKNFLEKVKIKLMDWCNIREKTNHFENNNSEVIETNDKSDCPIYTKDELEGILSSLDKIIFRDGFHYSKDYDNLGLKLEVCEQNLRQQGNINIPETVKVLKVDAGIYTEYILPVTSIGYCAFEAYPNLTRITIPKTVVEIKEGAFRYCRELRFVNIPNSVKYIGYQAFCGCSSLKSIVLPSETIEFKGEIFKACKSLQDVEFTSVAKIITADVFKGCYSLQSIIVPKGSKGKFTFVLGDDDVYLSCLLKEKEDVDSGCVDYEGIV